MTYKLFRTTLWIAVALVASAPLGHAASESNQIVLHFVPGMAKVSTAMSESFERTLNASDLAPVRAELDNLIAEMPETKKWWDVGPDAPYVVAEIRYQGETYEVLSWYPIYRNHPKIAVSEARGLVMVSGLKERKKVEAENSARYRKLIHFWNAVLPPHP